MSARGRGIDTEGMSPIKHLERKRTFTLQVTPPAISPQTTMETIEQSISRACERLDNRME